MTKLKAIWNILTCRTWFAVTYKYGQPDHVFAECNHNEFAHGVYVADNAFRNAMKLEQAEFEIEQQIKEALK